MDCFWTLTMNMNHLPEPTMNSQIFYPQKHLFSNQGKLSHSLVLRWCYNSRISSAEFFKAWIRCNIEFNSYTNYAEHRTYLHFKLVKISSFANALELTNPRTSSLSQRCWWLWWENQFHSIPGRKPSQGKEMLRQLSRAEKATVPGRCCCSGVMCSNLACCHLRKMHTYRRYRHRRCTELWWGSLGLGRLPGSWF
jgi:hypothetical protein